MTAAHRAGQILWIADNGHRYVHGTPSYGEVRATGRLAALDLQGKIVDELIDPQVRGDCGRCRPH